MRGTRTLVVTLICVIVAGAAPLFFATSPRVVAGVTIGAGAIPAIVDFATASRRRRADPGEPERVRAGGGAGALALGLAVILAIGAAAAYGISYGVAFATGNEPVRSERLVVPVGAEVGPLAVTVERIGVTDHYTKVELVMVNTAEIPATVTGSVQLVDGTGHPLGLFWLDRGSFDIPQGGVPIRRALTFSGRPADGATSATLTFSRVFWPGFGDLPQSFQVAGMPLADPG